jgi:hypothetical protein
MAIETQIRWDRKALTLVLARRLFVERLEATARIAHRQLPPDEELTKVARGACRDVGIEENDVDRYVADLAAYF